MDAMHDAGERCPGCSLKRAEWLGSRSRGYVLDDVRYCCYGCAEESGCTCHALDPEAVGGGETREHPRPPRSQ